MTTGLENISRHTGHTSCFSRLSMAVPLVAPGPDLPADGGLQPRAKFIGSQGNFSLRRLKDLLQCVLAGSNGFACCVSCVLWLLRLTFPSCSSLNPTGCMSEAPPNPNRSPAAATLVTATKFSSDGFSYSITMESFQKRKIKPNNHLDSTQRFRLKLGKKG